MPEKFEPVDADFGKDVNADIEAYVDETLDWLIQSYKELHESRVPKYRKLYLGIPAEANKSFPWPNASNVIVQVIGEIVDTLVARVLGLLYATHPLWVYHNFKRAATSQESEEIERARRALEDFMDKVGYEPSELDLYSVEGDWFDDAAKLGNAYLKVSLEDITEAVIVGYSAASKKRKVEERTLYYGPRVSKLRFEDVLADPAAPTLREARFTAHRRTLKRKDLEERAFQGFYAPELVKSLLDRPDRYTPTRQVHEEQEKGGVTSRNADDTTAEWDIYECYFPWWHNKRKYRLIYSYHKHTKTVLRKVFNFLPQHSLPILMTRVGARGSGLLWHGYAEMLEAYQEGASTTLNQRVDNATVANIRCLRVSPRARTLDASFELYPAGLIIAEKDEAEAMQVGDVYPSSFENEQVFLRHVQARAGLSPAVSGAGAGGMTGGRQRPVYSAMGTLAVMQESNTRVGLATSDFRHAHVHLGSLLTALYAKFGTDGKEQMFGIDSRYLKQALDEFDRRRLGIPIRAATASMNREVEKQNDMILAGLVQRHYTSIAQLLQALNNPMIPDNDREYLTNVVRASNSLMRRILKDFGYDEPDQFVPEPKLQTKAPSPVGGGGQMAPGGPPVGGPLEAAIPRGGSMVSVPSGPGIPGWGPGLPRP